MIYIFTNVEWRHTRQKENEITQVKEKNKIVLYCSA